MILVFATSISLFACNKETVEDPTVEVADEETERQTEHRTERQTEHQTECEETPSDSEKVTDSEANGSVKETEGLETESDANSEATSESGTAGSEMTESESALETEGNTEDMTEELTTKEEESEEMESNVLNDGLASVGKYEEYDLDSYMTPIWDGKVVHNETVMFVGIDDKAPLLYDADKIISVRSYDLKIEYVQGVDYDYVDGKLVLLEGTRIPYVPLETYYSVLDPEYPYLSTMYNGQVTQTMFGDGTTMIQWQVAVTYKHTDTWEGPVVESYVDRYADLIKKLENGEDVTVFFYGDSITTGATSSLSRAPYAPSYPRMFVQYVAKQYGYTVKYVDSYSDTTLTNGKPSGGTAHADTVFGTNGAITYVNNAVGGWSTSNGVDNYSAYVGKYIARYGCDLFVLAFGMNNGGSSAKDVSALLEQIVKAVYRSAPETDVVLVSTMIPNPEAVKNPADKYYCNGNQHTFEEEMYPLADKINTYALSCAVAPMTSVSKYMHEQKRYRDTTGNNVNHPSDFLARTYAQVIYQTVFGYENYEEEPAELGETPVINANYNAIVTQSGNQIYLDGKQGTTNANNALCVRLESTTGGYFMYYVTKGTKMYINSGIEYSADASTVWTYNATVKAMVCEESDTAIKLVTPEICLHPVVIDSDGHYREACVRCGIEKESGTHSLAETVIQNADGSTEYAMRCPICGYNRSSYTVPKEINHYYPLLSISLYNGTNGGILTKDGMVYHRSIFTNGDGYIYVNGGNTTSSINGKTGNYLVIKYRASGNSRVRFDLCTSDHEADWSMVDRKTNISSAWETAVIDLAQFENYTCNESLNVQVRITTASEYFDIAYVAIVDSLSEAKRLMSDATYVLYTDWSGQGTEGNVSDIPDKEESKDMASVGVYDKYDLDSYMTRIWDGKVVHNETVLFVGPDDTPTLLYSPDKVISVRSYDLKTEYIEGVDYEIVDGKIVRLDGSRIPYIPLETYYSSGSNAYLSTMYNGVVTQTLFGEGDTICKWQIAVTYKHSDTWEGPELESYEGRFADLIDKLEKGEDVTFFFYGDSITAGGNSSEAIGKAPYTPIWARMFTMYVAKQYGYTVKFINTYSDQALTAGKPGGGGAYADAVYGTNGTITYVNNAVGGWSTEQGNNNFDAYVKAYIETYGCDLFVLAFGMNNGGSTADHVAGFLEQIVGKVEACASEADVLLVSTMIPNPEAVRNPNDTAYFNGNQSTFEAAMIPLAEEINKSGTACALAPMTSVSKYLHSVKRFRYTTGNNVNHPSDFLVRLYAQTLFQTVFGFENYDDGEVMLENKPVQNENFNAELTVSGNTVYLDGQNGTDNKNYAVCVRFEAVEGGYYMYYVKDSNKVYVNAVDGAISYSSKASSVWVYDETLSAIVSGGCEVKLSSPEICYHPIVVGVTTHGKVACTRCGVMAEEEAHIFVDEAVVNPDGSTSYQLICDSCGKSGKSYTVPAGVIYYSASATYSSPIFYLLNKELKNEDGQDFTRVTAKTSDHGHELHWIDQNSADHYDYSGKQLDTEGARYVVIKLRTSSKDIRMSFVYRLLGSANTPSVTIPTSALSEGEWVTLVIDLVSATPDTYVALADGTYTMQTFKMVFSAGFDAIENGYVDFAYMAMCDDFNEIAKIADQEELVLVAASGSANVITKDGECIGAHSITETVDGNTYS